MSETKAIVHVIYQFGAKCGNCWILRINTGFAMRSLSKSWSLMSALDPRPEFCKDRNSCEVSSKDASFSQVRGFVTRFKVLGLL